MTSQQFPKTDRNATSVQIYVRETYHNARLGCTVWGAWICETDAGEFAICPDYAANTPQEALAILNGRGDTQYRIN